MNELIHNPPELGLTPTEAVVPVLLKPHPFRSAVFSSTIGEGASLAEIVIEARAKRIIGAHLPDEYLRVAIDDIWIGQRHWPRVRPKAGHRVTIAVTPFGGEGDSKSMTQAIVGAILLVTGIIFVATGFGAGLGVNLIQLGGALLLGGAMGLLTQGPSLPKLSRAGEGDSSPNLFIQGARNEVRPFEPIPRVYGRHSIIPPYGAIPYSETLGDDQYVRMLFVLGYGPLAISDLKLGESSVDQFSDVTTSIRHGFPFDKGFTLYSKTVLEDQLAITLTTSYQTSTSQESADELSIDLTFPFGLFQVQDDGDIKGLSISYTIEYKLTSAGGWTTLGTFTLAGGRRQHPFIKGHRIPTDPGQTLERGQYDVRIKRSSAEGNQTTKFDRATWSILRTIRSGPDQIPIDQVALFPTFRDGHWRKATNNYKGGLATVEMRIRATDQLNGIPDNFNCICKSILLDYDSWVLDFDGTDDLINLNNTTNTTGDVQPVGAEPRTIECWAYARNAAGGLFQAGVPTGTLSDFSLRLVTPATNTWRVSIDTGAGGGNDIDVVLAGSVGAWHHYALVYDGANVALFYDGVQAATAALALSTDSVNILIGKWGGSAFFNGQIREFRVWAKAHTAGSLTINSPILDITRDDGLMAYYRLNEGEGETVYDYGTGELLTLGKATTGPYHATVTGTTWVAGPSTFLRWEPRPTSNPASVYRDILQGASNKRPMADSRIDLTELQSWHALNRHPPDALRCEFWMVANANAYLYIDLSSVTNYTIQSGDVLEYDVFWPTDSPTIKRIAVDLVTATTQLRSESAVDQNALSSHPTTDLSAYASGVWYHRTISIPVAMVGQAITKYDIACEYDAGATQLRAYVKDIIITDGSGTIRKSIWRSDDTLPTTAVDVTSDATQGYRIDKFEDVFSGLPNKGRDFNMVMDFRSNIIDALQMVAAPGRASFNIKDSLFTVVQDAPQSVPRQHFTPRNSADFQGRKIFRGTTHGLRIRYVNEDADWQQDEIVVYEDGYNADGSFGLTAATLFESLDVRGMTNADQVWRHGRYLLAGQRLRPEVYEFKTDLEHLICNRGDLVKVTHDVTSFGLAFGRVKSFTTNGGGGTIDTVTLDQSCPMSGGSNYSIRFRLNDGTSVIHAVTTAAGEQTTLTITTPTSDNIEVGNLFAFGETGEESIDAVVANIEPGADLSARLTLIPYDDAIYQAEELPIPEFDPNISIPPDTRRVVRPPVIVSITTDERALLRTISGHFIPRIMIFHTPSIVGGNVFPTMQQAAIRPAGSDAGYQARAQTQFGGVIFIDQVESGQSYDIRIRYTTDEGLASEWVDSFGVYVEGTSNPPPDLIAFDMILHTNGLREFTWIAPDPLPQDVIGVRIHYAAGTGLTWDDLAPLHSGTLPVSPWETFRPLASGAYTFGVKMIDVAGNLSTNAILVEKTLTTGGYANVNVRLLGWPGTKTTCFENDRLDETGHGELQATDQNDWADLGGGNDWSDWTLWTQNSNDVDYEHSVIDIGSIQTVVVDVSYSVQGTQTFEEAHSDDNVTYSGWAAVGSSVSGRYFKVRANVAPASGLAQLKQMIIIIE